MFFFFKETLLYYNGPSSSPEVSELKGVREVRWLWKVRGHGRRWGCKQVQPSFIYEAAASAGVMVAQSNSRVVIFPTGIGSWSRGQRSRGWGKQQEGCVFVGTEGVASTGVPPLQRGHTCHACQSASRVCVVTVGVCVCVCVCMVVFSLMRWKSKRQDRQNKLFSWVLRVERSDSVTNIKKTNHYAAERWRKEKCCSRRPPRLSETSS